MGKEAQKCDPRENIQDKFRAVLVEIGFVLLLVVPPLVTQVNNALLTRIPVLSETKDVIFHMDRHSPSGPDGFNRDFFVACWDIIGAEIC